MLSPDIEAVLRSIALYDLCLRDRGCQSPLGEQLAKAEKYAMAMTSCRQCRGTGYISETVAVSSEDLAYLATHGLPAAEERACPRCQGSGRVPRRVKSKTPRGANAWEYMHLNPTASEPSYEMADPPGISRIERAVLSALRSLPESQRCALLEFYADRDFETPNPINRVVPLTSVGSRRAKKHGFASAMAASDLHPDAESLLSAAASALLQEIDR